MMPPPPVAVEPSVMGDEYQERDLVRLLILYGDKSFSEDNQQSVAQFIMANIDDVIDNFDNELYQRVAKEFQVLVEKGELPSASYFMQHETEELRKLAIDMVSTPYEFSENWEKRWEVILNQKAPEENFIIDSAHGLKRFRLRKLTRLCQENVDKLKELTANNELEELVLYMKLQQRLQTLRNGLANELGTVVL